MNAVAQLERSDENAQLPFCGSAAGKIEMTPRVAAPGTGERGDGERLIFLRRQARR